MTPTPLWTAKDAMAVTGRSAAGDWDATGISIDTRSLDKGDLFVALAGPNFDGHDYVGAAFNAGACAAIVDERHKAALDGRPGLIVTDTLAALRDLATAARTRTAAKIVAITGSVGKTGTKEALGHVLSSQGVTCFSKSSLNNHWGVPLSLARMPTDTKFGIFEIGMNHAGEITPLVNLTKPHIAIITAIAPAHIKFFDDLENIARAKAEIFIGLDGGTAVINRDTEFFGLLSDIALNSGADRVVSFGGHVASDMRLLGFASDSTGNIVDASWKGRTIQFRVGQPGVHWAYNSLAVLITVDALGGDLEAAAAELSTLPPLPGRGDVHVIPWGDGNIQLIDDSYNANPASMASALKTLRHMQPGGGRRIAILGDMLELGAVSAAAHTALKSQIEQSAIDCVFLAGQEIKALADILDPQTLSGSAEDASDLLPMIISCLKEDDAVVVKASNDIGLSSIVKSLIDLASLEHAANRD